MRELVKKQFFFIYKNKLFWAGICFLILGSYFLIFPLFRNFSMNNLEKMEKYANTINVELSGKDRYNYMIELIIDELERVNSEYPEEYTDEIFNKAAYEKFRDEFKNTTKSLEEIDEYLVKNFKGVANSEFFYQLAEYKKGTFEETEQFISEKLNSHSFSYYFGKKYADYFGMLCFVYAVILFPFTFNDDLKKDIREVIYTKPIKAYHYIYGKIIGTYTAMVSTVLGISGCYTVYLVILSHLNGFEFKIAELWFFIIFSILPSLFACCIISSFIAVLCKSALPAIPVMILYFFYSNLPLPGQQGWTVKPLTLFLRFDGELFDLISSKELVAGAINQIIILVISFLLLNIMVWIWRRRTKWGS